MKVVGFDTIDFLSREKLTSEYITVLDDDFSEINVNENYVILTKVNTEEDPKHDVLCMCFYFGSVPPETTEAQIASILSDHVDMLADISVFMHFSTWDKVELDNLGDNPSMETRVDLFEKVVG